MAALIDWLDHRTGYRAVMSSLLLEHVPGGARWRYVWGSCLSFVFALQLLTGLLLMTAYSPGDTTAWSSTHYIQYKMDFGWLIRGLHHFGSQTMMVLIALHMLQVVLAGAHLPPREFNWWIGMCLFAVTFGLSLTGYLLPWDQKGYWATGVATNIASNMPGGDFIKQVIVGGPDYGNHTLTRFFALHVGILPLAFIALLVVHIALFRRHGVTAPANAKGVEYFWPGQVFRDQIACFVVFGIMVWLVLGMPPFDSGHGNTVNDHPPVENPGLYRHWAQAGQRGLGANLDAPADRDTAGYPARPEWYFLFLFQMLKYFDGPRVFIGTVVIPNGAFVLLLLLPLLGYGRMRGFGYWVSLLILVALLLGAVALTLLAFAGDSPHWAPKVVEWMGTYDEKEAAKPDVGIEKAKKIAQEKAKHEAEKFEAALEDAHLLAKRAAQLAMDGVPAEGSRVLLRKDPITVGSKLFKTNCASCHKFTDAEFAFTSGSFKASDLGNFGTEEWVRGLLRDPGDSKFFGNTQLKGMRNWKLGVERKRERLKKKDAAGAEKQIAAEEVEFDQIAKWVVDQKQPSAKRDKALEAAARPLFENHCATCHTLGSGGGEEGPDLTNYASPEWIRGLVMNPAHKSRYGRYYSGDGKVDKAGLMPAFRWSEGPSAALLLQEFYDGNPDFPRDKVVTLPTEVERELIIRFLTHDDRVVFGGDTISGVPR